MATEFHAFTIKHNGITDRIITEVKVTQAFDPHNQPTPLPSLVATTGLWDTGATKSVITPSVAAALGVVPTGTVIVNAAHGSKACNTYLVNLYLPNQVAMPGLLVSECEETAHFGVIIGMDVIAAGDFSVTNVNGQTWVSFRTPSVVAIDYVAEAQRINTQFFSKLSTPRVGRNEPCPCGSKKKYKKCCGA